VDDGAVWILFLNSDGTVRGEQAISSTAGGFEPGRATRDFGNSLACIGDLDRDGVVDLAVGEIRSDDGEMEQGAIWILFLNDDGTVKSEQKIGATDGDFRGSLGRSAFFGASIANLGDLNGDGSTDLAVTAPGQNLTWMLFLDDDGTVESERTIVRREAAWLGAVTSLGDLDGNGISDLAIGDVQSRHGGLLTGSLWITFLRPLTPDGCFTFDFEATEAGPLVNGQSLDSFACQVSIAGSNHRAALFDSTRGGPNDPRPEPDLLVNTGNLLILQGGNLAADANGVFPNPNADDDGGVLSLTFPTSIEARSVRLVDIDASDSECGVVLGDSSGRRRTYVVPADWTGDRTLLQPGQGTLDLVTLDPQPGFGSVATAFEDSGFDAGAVVRIDIVLGGDGGVDDVTWCAPDPTLAHARATVRNGSGVNPVVLSSVATPVLGGTWAARLDCTAHGSGLASLVVAGHRVVRPTVYGELLIGGGRVIQRILPHASSTVFFAEPVPSDAALAGVEVFSQGVCTGSPIARVTNALDLVLGF
jgi:hypothetical protein